MSQMNRKSKVVNVVLLAVTCLLLSANISLAISPEELQKIEDAAPAKANATPRQPRKLLVFDLCNDYKHSSIPYWNKAIEIMGRKTGAYVTVVSNDMSTFKKERLGQFDAVCLNNTTKLDFGDSKLRDSLMNFVKGGKGIVGIHAASDNFYDWPEAAEMIGAQFSGHPWTSGGTWAIKIDDPQHPLTAAFNGKGFKIKDELYRTKPPFYSRSKQRVLLSLDMTDEATRNVKGFQPSDADTGISWVKSYGKGRVFYSSLGHNHDVVWTPAVLQHYLDGIQFALGDLPADTTPRSQRPLSELLAEIAAYEYGQSRQPLAELDDLIRSTSDSPEKLREIEKQFLEFLRSDARPAGKQFICRKLSVIGTKDSVPTLAAMLTEKATSKIEPSDMARYALERIPGPVVDEALRAALNETGGKVKVGIINSIGERGDRKAVKQLSELLDDSDKEIVEAAISALGKIGGQKAAGALAGAESKVGAKLHPVWADAYLMCADKLSAKGNAGSAMKIYRQLYVPGEPAAIRIAALRGMVTTVPKKAVGTILDVLKGDDEQIQAAAIGLLREIPGTKTIEAVTAELPNLLVAGQVQVLSALGDRGDRSALPTVIDATKSSEADVRIAALGALGALGDASSVDLLVKTAATTKGAEQEAAREGLYRLRGEGVDEKIARSIPEVDDKVKIELIRSIGQRNVVKATPILLRIARVPEKEVRLESLKVLKVIAEPKDLPALVGLMIYARNEAERTEAESTVVAVARKIEDKNRQAGKILAILPSVKEVKARCSMLRVLGKIGGSGALEALREALGDDQPQVRIAAIRALSDWPGDEPMNDLLKIAQSSGNQKHRVLALRGFVRLIGLDSDRPAEQMLKMYSQAMELATNVSEKKAVLSGLANVKSFSALQMAADYLEDSALQQEAEAAVVKIAESTHGSHPQQTKAVLSKVIQVSRNDSVRQQAEKLIKQIEQEEARSQEDPGAPGSAIKLIGGDFSTWRENTGTWQIVGSVSMSTENEKRLAAKPGSGAIINGPDGRTVNLFSKAEFGDVKAHIEFMVPRNSNSGVYFMGRYEIQILDSWGVREPEFSDCGGIYQRWDGNRSPKGYEGHPPRTNASLPPGQWQTYDVIFRAPRFDESGKKIANARFVKVVHNGIVVHENVEVTGLTRASAYQDEKPTSPLMLQGDHGPVAYRNVWILPMDNNPR